MEVDPLRREIGQGHRIKASSRRAYSLLRLNAAQPGLNRTRKFPVGKPVLLDPFTVLANPVKVFRSYLRYQGCEETNITDL